MSLTDRFFRRKDRLPELDLAQLQTTLTGAAPRYVGQSIEQDLLRARLADGCRDAGQTPLVPEDFDALANGLDEEAWRRLALLVEVLGLETVRAALPLLAEARALRGLVGTALTGLARETPLLTLELLRQSPLRVEELARRFIALLGGSVLGETQKVSHARLERLDYGRLLAEAERAKKAAAERVEHLRKLQDEQEARRPGRGKW